MRIIVILFEVILIASSSQNKSNCWQKWVNGNKFANVWSGEVATNSYFVIQDTIYKDFNNGTLHSIAKVIWQSCDQYSLIVRKLDSDKNEGLKVGDTLHVKIISIANDTVTTMCSALNFNAEIKFLKLKN